MTLTRATGDAKLGDSADADKLWANDTVRTDVHDANHAVITKVEIGTVVHDKAFVTRDANTSAEVPNPTGSVVFHRYATIDCTGEPVDQTVSLAADGTAESASFTTTGNLSYWAHYSGDANYPARDGACEPLRVIHPATTLTIVGTPVTKVKTGDIVTITLNEKNTGDDPITDVHLTGGSAGGATNCTWVPTTPRSTATSPPVNRRTSAAPSRSARPHQLGRPRPGHRFARQPGPPLRRGSRGHAGDGGRQPDRGDARFGGISPELVLVAIAILMLGLAFITPAPGRIRRRTP